MRLSFIIKNQLFFYLIFESLTLGLAWVLNIKFKIVYKNKSKNGLIYIILHTLPFYKIKQSIITKVALTFKT